MKILKENKIVTCETRERKRDAGRKRHDKGNRHGSEDADPSHGMCFSSARYLEREREMLEGKGTIKETDMAVKMQIQAMACASQALDIYDVFDCVSIAAHIKKDFDMMHGGGWQCVVGSNFGCYFTHKQGTFIYFSMESLNFLIFKGASS